MQFYERKLEYAKNVVKTYIYYVINQYFKILNLNDN